MLWDAEKNRHLQGIVTVGLWNFPFARTSEPMGIYFRWHVLGSRYMLVYTYTHHIDVLACSLRDMSHDADEHRLSVTMEGNG
jgi:hypothetical protein